MKNILLIFGLSFTMSACGMCENKIANSKVSPNGKIKAVVFNRNCGATTGFNTQISIINSENDLPNEGGNVFIMDNTNNIILNWLSDNRIEITGNLNNQIFKQNSELNGVQIIYRNTTL